MIMHHMPQLPAAPSALAPALAAGWSEHKSPAGVLYYYNTVTKVSTYDHPVVAHGNATVAALTTTETDPAPTNKSKWQTFTDERTGKKYYSDGVQTTWTRPAELPPEEGSAVTLPSKKHKSDSEALTEEHDRRPKKKKSDKEGVSLYANKAEAGAAFKGLLLAKDIAPSTKWADVVRVCSNNIQWEACSTMSKGKQALAEYQTKHANKLKDVKLQEKVWAKEAYQR